MADRLSLSFGTYRRHISNARERLARWYASDDRAGQIRAAEAAATKALALAPDNANAHVTYGTVLYAMCAPERALRESKLAIGLDGNLAIAHAYLDMMKFFSGGQAKPVPMSRKRYGSVRAIRSSSDGTF